MTQPRSPTFLQRGGGRAQTAPATPTTLLERVTGADGLVQLVPKKVGGILDPVPALSVPLEVLKSRSLERPPPTKYQPKATTPTNEMAKPGPAEKKAEIVTSSKQDAPPPPGTMTKRPKYIDLPKPPQFSTTRPPGDRLSPALIRPPSPENPGSVDITPGLPILVVDDDRVTRMLMRRMLERLKCVVTTAVNGQQALELIVGVNNSQCVDTPGSNEGEYFADNRVASSSASRGAGVPPTPGTTGSDFALVFLDNQMPVLSGVEMVRKLRRLGRNDLVVGVTGNALLQDQEEYLAAGADQYVFRPMFRFRGY